MSVNQAEGDRASSAALSLSAHTGACQQGLPHHPDGLRFLPLKRGITALYIYNL